MIDNVETNPDSRWFALNHNIPPVGEERAARTGRSESKTSHQGPKRPAGFGKEAWGNQSEHVAVVQTQWYHCGVGAPPMVVFFSGDWDVHWGYGLLTHGHVCYEKQL